MRMAGSILAAMYNRHAAAKPGPAGISANLTDKLRIPEKSSEKAVDGGQEASCSQKRQCLLEGWNWSGSRNRGQFSARPLEEGAGGKSRALVILIFGSCAWSKAAYSSDQLRRSYLQRIRVRYRLNCSVLALSACNWGFFPQLMVTPHVERLIVTKHNKIASAS